MISSIFRHPWMLAALAAVAIPLLIELLFRLHRRRVDLPTIRWLLKHKDQKKIKRQNRLLILIRSLVIFFLVLAVARPIIGKSLFGGTRKRRVVVLLDATTSMGQRVGGTSAFALAQERAETLIRGLSEGTQVTVGVFGDEVRQVVEPAEEQDLLAAADAVRGLPPPGGAAEAGEVLQFAADALAQGPEVDNEVYVFSDFQRHTWLEGRSVAPLMQQLTDKAEVFLVDVAPEAAFNLLVTRFAPVEPIATVGMPVEFRASIAGFGAPPAGDRSEAPRAASATFFVTPSHLGIRQKKDVEYLDLGAQPETRQWNVGFKHTFTRPGEYLVEVELSGDENALDNRRQYLISVPAEQRVLIFDPTAAPQKISETSAPESVPLSTDLKSYFLQQAISPEQPPGYDKVSHFTAEVRHPRDASSVNLNHYCAVILAGLTEWPEVLIENCEVYVRDGGALLLFLDEGLDRFDFNRKLVKGGEGLMPVVLEAPVSAAGGSQPLTTAVSPPQSASRPAGTASDTSDTQAQEVTLALSNSPHQALAVFAQETTPVQPRVLRYVPLSVLTEAAGQVQVVVAFSNGAPAILERRYGQGRVVLFNLTADARWTDTPALRQFVELMQEMLRYLVGNPDGGVNLEVGDVYASRVLKTSQHLRLICPDGVKERVTPRRAPGGGGAGWEVEHRPQRPGVYRIDARRGEVPRPRFVVNLPAVEGDPSRLSRGDVTAVVQGVPFTWVRQDQSIAEMVARRYSVIEAAILLLWLVAGLLAVESLLAALFGRRRGLLSVQRLVRTVE